jgi:hypothetical protein
VREETFLAAFHCFKTSILDKFQTVRFLSDVQTAKNEAHVDNARQVPIFR